MKNILYTLIQSYQTIHTQSRVTTHMQAHIQNTHNM